jgi:hypothetical protein
MISSVPDDVLSEGLLLLVVPAVAFVIGIPHATDRIFRSLHLFPLSISGRESRVAPHLTDGYFGGLEKDKVGYTRTLRALV